jgi:phosphoenolpyruvate carboxykinase (ATP)
LSYTRAIIDAIHDGTLFHATTTTDPVFGLEVPTHCPNVPSEILIPKSTWKDKAAFDATSQKLATLFIDNFKNFESDASEAILGAGPKQVAGAKA